MGEGQKKKSVAVRNINVNRKYLRFIPLCVFQNIWHSIDSL